jgi:hypothetical protein
MIPNQLINLGYCIVEIHPLDSTLNQVIVMVVTKAEQVSSILLRVVNCRPSSPCLSVNVCNMKTFINEMNDYSIN